MDEKSAIKTVPKCKNILGSEKGQGQYKPLLYFTLLISLNNNLSFSNRDNK